MGLKILGFYVGWPSIWLSWRVPKTRQKESSRELGGTTSSLAASSVNLLKVICDSPVPIPRMSCSHCAPVRQLAHWGVVPYNQLPGSEEIWCLLSRAFSGYTTPAIN
jgi:hypothetical protein